MLSLIYVSNVVIIIIEILRLSLFLAKIRENYKFLN